ncbi:hypothetical protein DL766_008885 [Monosporascus sp. MC13-8B]|uniref:Fucose-specific lectin n=1 Tax=Monosporascus cannonballus TaxID=155416 RepID=A0ABY0HHY0_9PEZI|nr:hypothetical protein DL762_000892 [Monosporascus cannonballus]RYO95538.1 hypothetical protein DL763_003690 [Monosporascus cannonballus]RYP17547.1 hypothetical protein DL766_008885 [Monosporascus sp. MC13-8B]
MRTTSSFNSARGVLKIFASLIILFTAVASSQGDPSGDNWIRLYYLSTDDDIIEPAISCSGATCTWGSNRFKVRTIPTSGLPAAYVRISEGDWGLRVYYLSSRSFISELAWYSSSGWTSGYQIGEQAHANSSLAVSVEPGTPNLQVYYMVVDGSLSQISWASGKWSSGMCRYTGVTRIPSLANMQYKEGTVVRGDLPSNFHPMLAAVAWSSPSSRRLYYVNESKHVEELLYQDGTWASQPKPLPAWPEEDVPGGPVAAVTWAKSVTVYYLSGGIVVDADMDSRDDKESMSLQDKMAIVGTTTGVVGIVATLIATYYARRSYKLKNE